MKIPCAERLPFIVSGLKAMMAKFSWILPLSRDRYIIY